MLGNTIGGPSGVLLVSESIFGKVITAVVFRTLQRSGSPSYYENGFYAEINTKGALLSTNLTDAFRGNNA